MRAAARWFEVELPDGHALRLNTADTESGAWNRLIAAYREPMEQAYRQSVLRRLTKKNREKWS